MANLYYRHQVPSSLPEATTSKGAPLSVSEMNANFKALDNYILDTNSDVSNIESEFIDTINVFTKNQSVSSITAYKSANEITVDASLSNNFRIIMDSNYLLKNPTGYGTEQTLNFFIKQGATPYVLTFDTKYVFPNNVNPPLMNEPHAVHLVSAHYDAFSDKFICSMSRHFLPSRYVIGSVASSTYLNSLNAYTEYFKGITSSGISTSVGNIISVIPDPYWADVITLLNGQNTITTDSSSFANTLTINGSAVLNSEQTLFGYTTYKIPDSGNSSRIQIDNNFYSGKFGTNEWCVETWYYPTSTNPADGRFTSFGGILLSRKTDGRCEATVFIGGASYSFSSGAGALPVNSWHHIALVRDSTTSTIKLFINGILDGSTSTISNTLSMDNTGFGWLLGYNDTGSFGYFSNFRVTRNHARYYSNFSVPTAPFNAEAPVPIDPYFANVKFLAHYDTTTTDTTNHAVSASYIAALSSTQSKFGGSSIYLDSANVAGKRHLAYTSSDFVIGTQNFTLEGWIYPTTTGDVTCPISINGYYENYNLISGRSSTSGAVSLHNWGGYLEVLIDGQFTAVGATITSNQWTHISVSRSGTTIYVSVNGVVASATMAVATLDRNVLVVGDNMMGSVPVTTSKFTGYVDDVRLTIGTARYTSNFTVPTAPFPNQ